MSRRHEGPPEHDLDDRGGVDRRFEEGNSGSTKLVVKREEGGNESALVEVAKEEGEDEGVADPAKLQHER